MGGRAVTAPASTSLRSPVGTVLTDGSSSLNLTERESQIADLVVLGYSHKKIGHELGITAMGVACHVSKIAARIPGTGSAKLKVAAWIWTYGQDITEES